mmetsp:Transcript_1850/g.4251  ORF Transcript_1850/g.4251 Transcript_1850/m.4251 type:complete len:99 (-) Transcript_1850:1833-2129(-)
MPSRRPSQRKRLSAAPPCNSSPRGPRFCKRLHLPSRLTSKTAGRRRFSPTEASKLFENLSANSNLSTQTELLGDSHRKHQLCVESALGSGVRRGGRTS